FGLHIMIYILCEMAGKPILNPLPTKNLTKLYDYLLHDLFSCIMNQISLGSRLSE
ncbi:hypothetical protein P692DRAFT_20738537, partial [Suillus brevipes Sb2]